MKIQESVARYGSFRIPLLATITVVLLGFGFAILASEVGEGETHVFDTALLHWAMELRGSHAWLAEVMRDFSGLGSTAALTLLTLATGGYLYLIKQRMTALLVAISIGSAAFLWVR